jgi:hypothetical protein
MVLGKVNLSEAQLILQLGKAAFVDKLEGISHCRTTRKKC